MSFLRLILAVSLLGMMLSCKHTPNAKEMQIAEGKRALAIEQLKTGKYRRALGELLDAEKLNPEDPEINYALGLVYVYGFKRHKEARVHLRRALAGLPKYSEANNLMGVTYLEEQRYAEAIPFFRAALDNLLYATPQFAKQNLGWALYKDGRVEQGLRTLEETVQEAPNLCGAYFQLGVAHDELRHYDKSVKWFEAFRSHCDSTELTTFVGDERLAEVLYRLAMAEQKRNHVEQARQYLDACLQRFAKTHIAEDCQKSRNVLP